VQGCGQCLDYCRWVGYSGSGGSPAHQTEKGKSYWSCDLAGSGDPYTAKGHFGTKFEHQKCAGVPSSIGEGDAKTREKQKMTAWMQKKKEKKEQQRACAKGRSNSIEVDAGYEDDYRGWYDVQGCGQCLDYCRWVGYSGSGGDPALRTQTGIRSKKGGSYWSCDLAGSSNPYTDAGYFGTKFERKKCDGVNSTFGEGDAKKKDDLEKKRQQTCAKGKRDSTDKLDEGYDDKYRGWYDVQGCGQCLDYCRWVGHSGSGGDPAERTRAGTLSKKGGSYWSCDLAGSGDPYTKEGRFGTSFPHKRCAGVNSTVGEGSVPAGGD